MGGGPPASWGNLVTYLLFYGVAAAIIVVFIAIFTMEDPPKETYKEIPSETVPNNCLMRENQGMENSCHKKEWT